MTHHTVDYRSIIHQKGHRLTPQRELVLDIICQHGPHCTSEQVYALVQQADRSMARSTIYRTLDFLCEVGLIVGSHLNDAPVYEVAVGTHAHHHAVCDACDVDIELNTAPFEALFTQIEAQYGFAISDDHLVLGGLCQDCRSSA